MLVGMIAVVMLDELFVDERRFGQFRSLSGQIANGELLVGQIVFEAVAFAGRERPGIASRNFRNIDEFKAWRRFEILLDGIEIVENIGFEYEIAAGFEENVCCFKKAVIEQSAARVFSFPPGIGEEHIDGIDGMGLEQDGQSEFCIGMNHVSVGQSFAFEFSHGDAAKPEFEFDAQK